MRKRAKEEKKRKEKKRKNLPNNLANVGRDEVADKLLGVVEDGAALLDSRDDGGKVVVSEDHVGGFLGDSRARAHGDTNVGLLEGRRIVDAVTSHGADLVHALEHFDELHLVCRLGAGEQVCGLDGLLLLLGGKSIKLAAGKGLASEVFILFRESQSCQSCSFYIFRGKYVLKDADLLADGLGGVLVVASDDDHTDTSVSANFDRLGDLGTWRIAHADKAHKDQVALVRGKIGGVLKRVLVLLVGVVDSGESEAAESELLVGRRRCWDTTKKKMFLFPTKQRRTEPVPHCRTLFCTAFLNSSVILTVFPFGRRTNAQRSMIDSGAPLT